MRTAIRVRVAGGGTGQARGPLFIIAGVSVTRTLPRATAAGKKPPSGRHAHFLFRRSSVRAPRASTASVAGSGIVIVSMIEPFVR